MAGVTDRPFRMPLPPAGAGYCRLRDRDVRSCALWHRKSRTPHGSYAARGRPGGWSSSPAPILEAVPKPHAQRAAARRSSTSTWVATCKKAVRGVPRATRCSRRAAGRRPRSMRSCAPWTFRSRSRSAPARSSGTSTASRSRASPPKPGCSRLTVPRPHARCDFYEGAVEYDTIAAVSARCSVPVFANGDIGTPGDRRGHLALTPRGWRHARRRRRRPWIFREVAHFLTEWPRLRSTVARRSATSSPTISSVTVRFYGEDDGSARRTQASRLVHGATHAGRSDFRRVDVRGCDVGAVRGRPFDYFDACHGAPATAEMGDQGAGDGSRTGERQLARAANAPSSALNIPLRNHVDRSLGRHTSRASMAIIPRAVSTWCCARSSAAAPRRSGTGRGNHSRAADILGINRGTLRALRQHGLV